MRSASALNHNVLCSFRLRFQPHNSYTYASLCCHSSLMQSIPSSQSLFQTSISDLQIYVSSSSRNIAIVYILIAQNESTSGLHQFNISMYSAGVFALDFAPPSSHMHCESSFSELWSICGKYHTKGFHCDGISGVSDGVWIYNTKRCLHRQYDMRETEISEQYLYKCQIDNLSFNKILRKNLN